jgi:uncharacterized protein with HEPN domain
MSKIYGRYGEEFCAAADGLIIGFRNIAVHAYFSVDWRIVFVTVVDDLPVLKQLVAAPVKR